MSKKTKKLIILNIPYFLVGLFCTNLGEAWRIAWGSNMSEKVQGLVLYGGFSKAKTGTPPEPAIIPANQPSQRALKSSETEKSGNP